jgi:hypothetical protein
MPTLILSPRHTDDSQALWRVTIERGWDVHRLTTWRIPEEARRLDEPFLYVEALFGATLADELGVRLLNPTEDWLCKLPDRYTRREIRLSTLEEARSLTKTAFIKPPNDKSFPAAVYAPGELPSAFDGEMAVLISEPVRFVSEFRCFVLDRRIRTFSLYARNGEAAPDSAWAEDETEALRAFALEFLSDDDVDLPRACVVDCGPIEGRGWGIVELNAAWGAGLYRCDPNEAIDVVRAATEGAA